MSKNYELLKSYADDFSNVLGVECKVISGGSKDIYAIAKCMGDGAVKAITAFDTSKSLVKICQAYLDGVQFQLEKSSRTLECKQSIVTVGRWDMPHYIGNITIGAQCNIVFKDDPESILDRYISFGQHNVNTNQDQFGVDDNEIFFYAHEGEEQLKALMQASEEEFIVKSYKLSYPDGMEAIEDSFDYVMEIIDQRKSNGQVLLDVGAVEGDMDDLLSTTFEINKIPGTEITTQCMHLNFNGDAPAVSIFKKGDSYIIRPEQGVTIMPIRLEDGSFGYVLE